MQGKFYIANLKTLGKGDEEKIIYKSRIPLLFVEPHTALLIYYLVIYLFLVYLILYV